MLRRYDLDMPGALATLLPLITAAVLIASAGAKFRHPDDLAGWEELGVAEALRKPVLLRLHPWGELALGFALVVLGGGLGLIASLVALVLMGAYLWLVVRAFRREEGASCACFGTRQQISGLTVARNVWLTLLSAATVVVIWTNPLAGGALASALSVWAWAAAAAIAAVTAALVVRAGTAHPSSSPEPAARAGDGDGAEEIDYIRLRTPAVPVTLADGTVVNLRALASARPILLLAVSPTCASCTPVIDRVDEWREILPETDVRLLLAHEPEMSRLTEWSEPQSLHDPHGYVSGSLGEWPTPTAILLGADGLLAGGPVTGSDHVSEFVQDIRRALDEAAAAVTSP